MSKSALTIRWPRLVTAILLLAVILLPSVSALAETEAPFTVKFSGVIDVVPAAAGDPWQVAGYTVAVNEATRVRLTVGSAAAGMWADVMAQRLDDDSLLALDIWVKPPEVRLKGLLTAKPDEGPWTVAGQTIHITDETSVSQRSGPVEVGQWVEVHAVEEPAGVLTAVRVRGIEAAEDAEVYGAIQSFGDAQWVLSSIALTATADTLIVGEPQAGLLAQAAAELTDTGLSGRVFKVAWQEPNGNRQPVQLTGLIEALPDAGLLGLWQVAGQAVEVRENTTIFQVKGLVEVGARVHITGWQAEDRIVATNITVLNSSSGNGRPFNLQGNIEALPESGLFGAWTIAGQQVQVTRQTRIHGEQFVRLGAPAEAGGLQYQNGVRVLTWLRVREQTGPGPNPTVTPGPTHTPQPTHTPTGTPPLSAAEITALEQAIDEEYLALNTYQAVLTQLGNIQPFTRITPAEQQHVNALGALFSKYDLTTPGNPGLDPTPVFANRQAACQAGVQIETADAALYDVLLPIVTAHADLVQVFTNLQAASLNDHLPAFEACD